MSAEAASGELCRDVALNGRGFRVFTYPFSRSGLGGIHSPWLPVYRVMYRWHRESVPLPTFPYLPTCSPSKWHTVSEVRSSPWVVLQGSRPWYVNGGWIEQQKWEAELLEMTRLHYSSHPQGPERAVRVAVKKAYGRGTGHFFSVWTNFPLCTFSAGIFSFRSTLLLQLIKGY